MYRLHSSACMSHTGNTETRSNIACDSNNKVVTNLHKNIRITLTGACTKRVSCSLGCFTFLSFMCHERY
jgi:hypothetical protein